MDRVLNQYIARQHLNVYQHMFKCGAMDLQSCSCNSESIECQVKLIFMPNRHVEIKQNIGASLKTVKRHNQ